MTEQTPAYKASFDPSRYIRTSRYTNRKTGEVTERKILDTAPRIAWFRAEHPIDSGWQLVTDMTINDNYADAVSMVISPDGKVVSKAHRRVHKAEFANYPEKAETQSKGRALEAAGYGCTYALSLEPDEGEGEGDSAGGEVAQQSNGDSRDPLHWSYDTKTRAAFWAKARERGLSNDDVHRLAGVPHLAEFKGTVGELWTAIDAAIAKEAAK